MKTYQYKDIVAHYAKTMSQADAEAKAQRFAAANPDKVEGAPGRAEKKATAKPEAKPEAKPAPKATPKAAPPTKAPPKPAAAKAPEPPKPSPVVAAQVPKVGAKVYGAAPPPAQVPKAEAAKATPAPRVEAVHARGVDRPGPLGAAMLAYKDAPNPVTTVARTVVSPITSRIAEGREAIQEKVARYNRGPEPMMMEETRIYADVPKAAQYMERDYSNGGGWQFTEPREVPAMRERLKKLTHLAGLDVDGAPDSDIRELYAEEFGR